MNSPDMICIFQKTWPEEVSARGHGDEAELRGRVWLRPGGGRGDPREVRRDRLEQLVTLQPELRQWPARQDQALQGRQGGAARSRYTLDHWNTGCFQLKWTQK